MSAPKEIQFIAKLIEQTEKKEVVWEYFFRAIEKEAVDNPFRDNKNMQEYTSGVLTPPGGKAETILDRSYWARVKEGYIFYVSVVINGAHSGDPVLLVQRDKTSNVNRIDASNDMSELYRLGNHILYSLEESSYGGAMGFIDSFLMDN